MVKRLEQVGPWAGIAFVVLFAVDVVVGGSEPQPGASAAKVISWYTAHRGGVRVADYLMAVVLVAGLFFYGFLRDTLAEDSPGLAATAFGGAVLFAVSGAVSSGLQLALADDPGRMGSAVAVTLNLAYGYLSAVAVAGGAAVLLLAAGLAIVRGARLPAWTGWLGLLCGVIALLPVRELGPLPAGIWTLIVSVALWLRRSKSSAVGHSEAARVAPSGAR